MPWTRNDFIRIVKYEAYDLGTISEITNADRDQLIQSQLDDITEEAMIVTIQGDLDKLDALDTLRYAEQGSTNNTLIAAGPLKWDSGRDRVGGVKSEFDLVRRRVARMLNQTLGGSAGSGQQMVYRG